MALAKVGAAFAAASSVALPGGWSVGDLAVVYAYRNNSTTPPSLPSGWTEITGSTGANANSRRVGYRVLQSGDTNTGTWTNATAIEVIVLSGQNSNQPIGSVASGGDNTTTLTSPADSPLQHADGSSWVLVFAGSKATNANGVTITGTTNEGSSVGALNLATARGVTTWAGGTYSAAVNAAGNRTDAVEIFAAGSYLRVSQAAAEVAFTPDSRNLRVSQVVAEVAFKVNLLALRGTAAGTSTATGTLTIVGAGGQRFFAQLIG